MGDYCEWVQLEVWGSKDGKLFIFEIAQSAVGIFGEEVLTVVERSWLVAWVNFDLRSFSFAFSFAFFFAFFFFFSFSFALAFAFAFSFVFSFAFFFVLSFAFSFAYGLSIFSFEVCCWALVLMNIGMLPWSGHVLRIEPQPSKNL